MLLVLFYLLLASSPGCSPSPTLAQDCRGAADKVVEEGTTDVIHTTDTKEHEGDINLFVMIESGFDGLSVHVHGRNGSQHSAWFLPEECFPSDGTWRQVGTWASLNSDDSILTVGFETPTCYRVCQIDSALQTLKNLTVVAHGTSRWIIGTPPRHCHITYLGSPSYPTTLPACQEPPSTTTNTTLPTFQEPPSTTTNTVALIGGIVVVGIVMVGILVVVVVSIVSVGIEVVKRKPARIGWLPLTSK